MNPLHSRIETLRNHMIKSGMQNGFTSKETIHLSQKLDRSLNELHRLKKEAVFSKDHTKKTLRNNNK
jgi:cell fate (sporulation/competence/biofilm development) regulator YmcA (YheA/YmcA/DUF963 family)